MFERSQKIHIISRVRESHQHSFGLVLSRKKFAGFRLNETEILELSTEPHWSLPNWKRESGTGHCHAGHEPMEKGGSFMHLWCNSENTQIHVNTVWGCRRAPLVLQKKKVEKKSVDVWDYTYHSIQTLFLNMQLSWPHTKPTPLLTRSPCICPPPPRGMCRTNN